MPPLNEREQEVAVSIYRLLSEGAPVAEERVAELTGVPVEEVATMLSEWPGVYRNGRREIVGFWGLAQAEFPPHALDVGGERLWAWCAWDSLFLPVVLGKTARVESVCAQTGEQIRLLVAPDGLKEIEPAGAVISFLQPDRPFDHDVILSFCHHILFFTSEEAGEQWIGDRDDAFLLSLEQGFELGRRVWEAKFGAALASEREAA